MDFSKLNIEFSNIQLKLEEYDRQLDIVLKKIKSLRKEISKIESKIKQTNKLTEKYQYQLILEFKKEQLSFLCKTFESPPKLDEKEKIDVEK